MKMQCMENLGRLILKLFVVLLGVMNNGNAAGITSSYVRSPFPSTDIPLNDSALAVPPGYNSPQQVHITQGDYNGKAVIITWTTPNEAGSSKVKYGLLDGKYDFEAHGNVSTYTFYGYKSVYIHQCLLDDLEYDTKYYYMLGEGTAARKFWFRTPPAVDPDLSYTFGVIGDLGQTFNSLATLRHFMQNKGEAVIYLGDLAYADRYYKNLSEYLPRWDSWGRLVENSTAYTPWFWCAGNHETDYIPSEISGQPPETPFKNYLHRYPTPFKASQSTSSLWYSIRRASAHIIVLNSYSAFTMFTPQWWWFTQELKNVNREETPWLIVVAHVPFYNSNEAHFLEGESMRVEIEKYFIEYRVDVVFAGHVHAYERMNRFSNVRDDVSTGSCHPKPDNAAPVYLTVGDGGNQEGLAAFYKEPQPYYSAFREASYGHGILEIKNRTHAVFSWHRNDDGESFVADSVVLQNQYTGK